MRRLLLFSLLLAALATPAAAQEVYSFSATAGQVNNFVDPGRVAYNEQKCDSAGLAFTCSEAELQAIEGFESDRIYPDSQAGREDYIKDQLLLAQVAEQKNLQKRWDKQKAREAWEAMSRAQKDAVCASFTPPLPAGCELN